MTHLSSKHIHLQLLRRPPRPGQIGVLVMSPTRELAMQVSGGETIIRGAAHVSGHLLDLPPPFPSLGQIHVETEKLAKFMDMSVQVVIGGTNMNAESKRMSSRAPHVLVGTPGRVLDHLTNDSSSMGRMVQDLRVLIFDEADNLLDMGFRWGRD